MTPTAAVWSFVSIAVIFIILFKRISVRFFYLDRMYIRISGELLALEFSPKRRKRGRGRKGRRVIYALKPLRFILGSSEIKIHSLPEPDVPYEISLFSAIIFSISAVYIRQASGKLKMPHELDQKALSPFDIELEAMPIVLIFAFFAYKIKAARRKGLWARVK